MTSEDTEKPLWLVASEDDRDLLAARYDAAGWTVLAGLVLDRHGILGESDRMLCTGSVAGEDDVEAALYAAAVGAGVVVVAAFADPIAEGAFADQFARVGGRRWEPPVVAPVTEPETVALLDRLAAGDSIDVAAKACFMSLRTANRRLSQARAHFGVATTLEAVLGQAHAVEG